MTTWSQNINQTCRDLQLLAFILWDEAKAVSKSYPALAEDKKRQAFKAAFDADTYANILCIKSKPGRRITAPKKKI